MAGNKYRFTPSRLTTQTNINRYVMENFRRVGIAIDNVGNMVVPTTTESPDNPVEGQLIVADGTNFNPGAGAGLYIYLNGAWSKV